MEPIDLEKHARLCEVVAGLVAAEAGREAPGLVRSVHDVSDGGLATTLAEQAVASDLGVTISTPLAVAEWFSEAPSRVVMTSPHPDDLLGFLRDAGLEAAGIGTVGGPRLRSGETLDVSVEDLRHAMHDRIPAALGESVGVTD
jgi:phosphoribosylformylglycinamidine synthase